MIFFTRISNGYTNNYIDKCITSCWVTDPSDWLAHLVIDVAIGEHGVEVLNAFTRTAVEIILQTLLDGPHVHGLLDDFMIILQRKKIVS